MKNKRIKLPELKQQLIEAPNGVLFFVYHNFNNIEPFIKAWKKKFHPNLTEKSFFDYLVSRCNNTHIMLTQEEYSEDYQTKTFEEEELDQIPQGTGPAHDPSLCPKCFCSAEKASNWGDKAEVLGFSKNWLERHLFPEDSLQIDYWKIHKCAVCDNVFKTHWIVQHPEMNFKKFSN